MKRLLEFVDSALGVVLGRIPVSGGEASGMRDALIERMSLADAAAQRWLRAEDLDLKNVSRLCRLAKLGGQAIGRCRMIAASGISDFDDLEKIVGELNVSSDRVEAGATPAGVTALSKLLQGSVRGILERLERAGVQSPQLMQDLSDVLVQARDLDAVFPRPAPTVGLVAACTKARAMLERDLDGVARGSELDLDLYLAKLIVGGLIDGNVEPNRHAYFFAIAMIKAACIGGADVVPAEAARRLTAIAACFGSFNLSCEAFFYLNGTPDDEPSPDVTVAREEEATTEVSAADRGHVETAVTASLTTSLPLTAQQPQASKPTRLELNFLTVVAGSAEVDDLMRVRVREIMDGRRPWGGFDAFLAELERVGASGFVRVGRVLERLANA